MPYSWTAWAVRCYVFSSLAHVWMQPFIQPSANTFISFTSVRSPNTLTKTTRDISTAQSQQKYLNREVLCWYSPTIASWVQTQCTTKTVSAPGMILWCYSHLVWLVSEGLIHALVFIQKIFLWFYWIAPVINVSLSFVPNVVPWSFAEVLSPQKTHKYN